MERQGVSVKGVRQINVSGFAIGLVDIDKILQEVRSLCISNDEELKGALLQRVKQKNYVPNSREEEYKVALLREYKQLIGEEIVEEAEEGLRIRILGPGCPNCEQLTQKVIAALTELGIAVGIEHIREPARIVEFGVMGTPALVINKEVKSIGRIPRKGQIKQWIEAELPSQEGGIGC